MDRNDFYQLLEQKGIPQRIVSFDNSINDGFNIRKNRLNWEAFLRERGSEFDCMGFPSESDALQYLLERIVQYYDSLQRAGLSIDQINQLGSRSASGVRLGGGSPIDD